MSGQGEHESPSPISVPLPAGHNGAPLPISKPVPIHSSMAVHSHPMPPPIHRDMYGKPTGLEAFDFPMPNDFATPAPAQPSPARWYPNNNGLDHTAVLGTSPLYSSAGRFPLSASPMSTPMSPRRASFMFKKASQSLLSIPADQQRLERNISCCGDTHPTYDDLLRHYELVHAVDDRPFEEDREQQSRGIPLYMPSEPQDDLWAQGLAQTNHSGALDQIPTTQPIDIKGNHSSAAGGGLFPAGTGNVDADLSALLAAQPAGNDMGSQILAKRNLSAAAFSMGSYAAVELKRFREGFRLSGVDFSDILEHPSTSMADEYLNSLLPLDLDSQLQDQPLPQPAQGPPPPNQQISRPIAEPAPTQLSNIPQQHNNTHHSNHNRIPINNNMNNSLGPNQIRTSALSQQLAPSSQHARVPGAISPNQVQQPIPQTVSQSNAQPNGRQNGQPVSTPQIDSQQFLAQHQALIKQLQLQGLFDATLNFQSTPMNQMNTSNCSTPSYLPPPQTDPVPIPPNRSVSNSAAHPQPPPPLNTSNDMIDFLVSNFEASSLATPPIRPINGILPAPLHLDIDGQQTSVLPPTYHPVKHHHLGAPVVYNNHQNHASSHQANRARPQKKKEKKDQMPDPNATPKPFRCPHEGCYKSYKNPNGLKYHLEHGHPEIQPAPSESSQIKAAGPKRFRCSFCDRRYKNLNGLKYHLVHFHSCQESEAKVILGRAKSEAVLLDACFVDDSVDGNSGGSSGNSPHPDQSSSNNHIAGLGSDLDPLSAAGNDVDVNGMLAQLLAVTTDENQDTLSNEDQGFPHPFQ